MYLLQIDSQKLVIDNNIIALKDENYGKKCNLETAYLEFSFAYHEF